MRKVLLISNYVYHYRINNYNYFFDEFKKIGYEFMVLANDAQKVDFDVKFQMIIQKPSALKYFKIIELIKPDVVITFLHLKDLIIFPVSYYCKLRRIPLIYWNFGINITRPDSKVKNSIYYHLHNISDAILLYSPNEKNVIRKRNHPKTFIAYNTLNFTDRDYSSITQRDYLHKKYGVKENFIVLFVGRITSNKRIDLLLSILRNHNKIAIVIVGKELSPEQRNIVAATQNYYNLGEIYDKEEVSKIFYSSDVFCIPGNMGLGLNEAFFWGKPVITIESPNSPEIYYLRNGINGYNAKDIEEVKNKIIEMHDNPEQYRKLSQNAKETADNEAHIRLMFKGFREAIEHVANEVRTEKVVPLIIKR